MIGGIKIELHGDLNIFCRSTGISSYNSHSGWIAVKSVRDANILAEGLFETIKGKKSGPIVSLLKRGRGELIYTSFHNRRNSEEMLRFFAFRISYKYLLDRLINEIERLEQRLENSIIDSVREW